MRRIIELEDVIEKNTKAVESVVYLPSLKELAELFLFLAA